jgi:uncharacterized protein DUF5671
MSDPTSSGSPNLSSTRTSPSNIQEFIERAKAGGASEQSLVGILAARGWPEKEVYEALAAHYERMTGTEIPRRRSTGTAAKDAFFHLVAFWTLGAWLIGLGTLAFLLIDVWLPDPVNAVAGSQGYAMATAAWSMASLLVAFPIFLLISRSLLRAERAHPEKLHAGLRKWLWYMVLVIAAAICIGDLVYVVTRLLTGELTARFVAQAAVVFALSGGVFFYYFGSLRRSEDAEARAGARDRWAAAMCAVVILVALIEGFSYIGGPKKQRDYRADQKRLQDLYWLNGSIRNFWSTNHKLPDGLDPLIPPAPKDPATGTPYEYHLQSGSQYELCAKFVRASLPSQSVQDNFWTHPEGRRCYAMDAEKLPDMPSMSFPISQN